MRHRSGRSAAALALVLAGCALRLGLAWVNRESNDDHLTVVRLIRAERRLPRTDECHQCHHPKLFHASAAAGLAALDLKTPERERVAVQLLSAAAGVLALWVLGLFLAGLPGPEAPKLLVLALAAANGPLVGISGQGTNDAWAILFGCSALLELRRHLEGEGLGSLALCALWTALANLSKGTGIPLALGVGAVLACRAAARRERQGLLALGLFSAVILTLVPGPGQYLQKRRDYGSWLVTNAPPDPWPHPWRESFADRPGTTSLLNTYATFRFGDMLRRPMINNQRFRYPLHRTSFWSQLYGKAHSVRYAMWPPSWQDESPAAFGLGRGLLLLGLVPAGLLLLGSLDGAARLAGGSGRARGAGGSGRARGDALGGWGAAELLVPAAYLGFLILYTARHHDFSTVKAVFLFPALPCLAGLLLRGFGLLSPHPRLASAASAASWALAGLYLADSAWLVGSLMTLP